MVHDNNKVIRQTEKHTIRRKISGVSLFLGVLMSRCLVAGRVRKGRKSTLLPGGTFLKQGLKHGLLMLSEQIVNGGGGHCFEFLEVSKSADVMTSAL